MKSEDIARYVAGLEAEVDRLHAAQPLLPDVGPVEWYDTDRKVLKIGRAHLWSADNLDEHEQHALKELASVHAARAFLDEPTPDTSRVTFGTRHEGTGMVLLQHADISERGWGVTLDEDASFHRTRANYRAAHAALAKVREALNTAEADGVDVEDDGDIHCKNSTTDPDFADWNSFIRARRYLAREVQALVDQGLRGDDLNARMPYPVRDHRAPVEAADTGSEAEDVSLPQGMRAESSGGCHRPCCLHQPGGRTVSTASDDLTQQLAEAMHRSACGCSDGPDELDVRAARAVLASGLVVPTSAVLNLARQWEDEAPPHDPRAAQLARGVRPELNEQRRRLVLLAVADELRALTRQENQK